ncbi:hypothetical protein ACN4EK_17285 [Pantanalinema rosaneae CENA516]|uniref:hypothetical protein n=1 Tax=Pantanalinema rosaneae TaxID=1620701 RepID=UPI003D6EEB31
MSFSTVPSSTGNSSPSMLKVLASRDQYRACHIRLPGDDHRMAAVLVEGKFYSLLKIVKEPQKALKICNLMIAKGRQLVVTKTTKGVAIWMYEPDAIVDSRTQKHLQAPRSAATELRSDSFVPPGQYQTCYIRVADLDDRLEAIHYNGRYYSLFKITETRQHALELGSKLQRRGDAAVMTQTSQRYCLWVWEPDARPVV